MSERTVLITGGGGQLASDLNALLSSQAEVVAPDRAELDITDHDAVKRIVADVSPSIVFNCAAFHNVDLCEQEESTAFAVNAVAVKRLAEQCSRHGAQLIHMSTNYVFAGDRPDPFTELDLPQPRSVYAASKLAGEHAALSHAEGSLVVRTAGLYGIRGSASKGGNFVTRMTARAHEEGELRMVADQELTPTFTVDLAESIIEAVGKEVTGVLHLTNSGSCSWYEFTEAILAIAGIDAQVHPVKTATPPGAAQRPLNGVLASTVSDTAGLSARRHWRRALEDYMGRAGLAATSVQTA